MSASCPRPQATWFQSLQILLITRKKKVSESSSGRKPALSSWNSTLSRLSPRTLPSSSYRFCFAAKPPLALRDTDNYSTVKFAGSRQAFEREIRMTGNRAGEDKELNREIRGPARELVASPSASASRRHVKINLASEPVSAPVKVYCAIELGNHLFNYAATKAPSRRLLDCRATNLRPLER